MKSPDRIEPHGCCVNPLRTKDSCSNGESAQASSKHSRCLILAAKVLDCELTTYFEVVTAWSRELSESCSQICLDNYAVSRSGKLDQSENLLNECLDDLF